MTLKGRIAQGLCQSCVIHCGQMVSRKGSTIAPSNKALATSYTLWTVTTNHVSICSGLAAIFNEKFQATNGRISEMVQDGV